MLVGFVWSVGDIGCGVGDFLGCVGDMGCGVGNFLGRVGGCWDGGWGCGCWMMCAVPLPHRLMSSILVVFLPCF